VLERRLEGRDYILDDYSIADMICWPWVLIAKPLGQSLDGLPNVSAWRARVKSRPAVQRGVDLAKDSRRSGEHSEESRKILFGQTARSLGG
jgi:GST-like protein